METIQERRAAQTGAGMKRRILRNPWFTLFTLVSMICLYVFFTKIHPLYIHDLDDWLYVYHARAGYPDVTDWNPTKILPEVLMPLVSYLGVYFLYPLSGDYIQSLCDAYAIVLTLLIGGYLVLTAKLLKKQFELSDLPLTLLMGIFLLGHFLPFLTEEGNNQHLFYSINVTCVFNYVIPALWNFILCLWFLQREKQEGEITSSAFNTGILIFLIYLAIFSSLWQSVILMSLFGTRLLFALIQGIAGNRRKGKKAVTWPFLLGYAREHQMELLSLCAWFAAMILELSGGRASFSTAKEFQLGTAVKTCIHFVLEMNPVFLVSVIGINLAGLLAALYRWKTKGEKEILTGQLELLGCMILCGTFVVLLGAKVGPGYLPRSDVMITWMLWLMLITITSLSYLAKLQPKLMWILPVSLFMLFCGTVLHEGAYANPYIYQQPPAVVKAVDEDIIAQIQEADRAGEESVEVHIPVEGSDGWPLDLNLTPNRISQALYRHGLTKRPIDVILVPDPQKDIEFQIHS